MDDSFAEKRFEKAGRIATEKIPYTSMMLFTALPLQFQELFTEALQIFATEYVKASTECIQEYVNAQLDRQSVDDAEQVHETYKDFVKITDEMEL